MRQPLVTRKNRKLRRLREQFPGVKIKLLYRRDIERVLSAFEPQTPQAAGVVIATKEQIEASAGW